MCHYFLTLALLIARIINIFLNFHNKTIHKKQHWHKFQKFLRVTCDLKVTFFTLVISQQHVSKFQKYFSLNPQYLFIYFLHFSIYSELRYKLQRYDITFSLYQLYLLWPNRQYTPQPSLQQLDLSYKPKII